MAAMMPVMVSWHCSNAKPNAPSAVQQSGCEYIVRARHFGPCACIPPSEMSSWQIEAEPLAMTYSASPISLYLYLHHGFVLMMRLYH